MAKGILEITGRGKHYVEYTRTCVREAISRFYLAPGTIRHVEHSRCYVILDSGEDGWFEMRQLRPLEVEPDSPEIEVSENVPDEQHLNFGDRVFARWEGDLFWYPGTIFSEQGTGYLIIFDDQDKAIVSAAQIIPLAVEVGDQVLCRPKFERIADIFQRRSLASAARPLMCCTTIRKPKSEIQTSSAYAFDANQDRCCFGRKATR